MKMAYTLDTYEDYKTGALCQQVRGEFLQVD